MKSIRKVLIISAAGVIISLGVVAYFMIWGPDRIQFDEKSLSQLLKSGDLTPIIVIPVALIITGLAILPFLRIFFPAEIKNGITAPAKVLEVWDTGVSINDNPQVGMLLEVTPPGGTPFQAKAKRVVSRLKAALVQPGVTAEVKYDTQKPQRLQILTININESPSSGTAARLEELSQLREKGLITGEEYNQKREEILKEL
jgi:hypothetical protein